MRLYTVLCFLFISLISYGQTEIPAKIHLDSSLYLFADSQKISYEQIKKIPLTQFKKGIVLDKNVSHYWVLVDYKHSFSHTTDWYFNFYSNNPIQVFDEEKQIATKVLPLTGRSERLEKYYIPVQLVPKQSFKRWIRFENIRYKYPTLKVQLIHKEALSGVFLRFWMSISAYTGILFVMMVYHFIIYFFVKEKSYLYFSSGAFFQILYIAVSEGIGAEYWGGVVRDILSILLSGMSLFFSWLFFRSLLNFSVLMPKADRFIAILLLVLELNVGLCVLEFSSLIRFPASMLNNIIVLLFSVSLIFTAFYVGFYKNYKPARYYFFADIFALLFLTLCLIGEPFIGIITGNELTKSGIKLGTVLRAVFFAIALAEKIKLLQEKIRQSIIEKDALEKKQLLDLQRFTEQKNKELEYTVQQRTLQLRSSNEELNQVNEELKSTIDTINQQQIEIRNAHTNITASINYAKKIQEALFPSKQLIHRFLPDSFIFYNPLYIVSGDFYWFISHKQYHIFAVADCTGHGVPGAFMSMIGINILNQIVVDKKIDQPHLILWALDAAIKSLLKKNDSENQDGMDIALVCVDKENQTLEFSGAKRPIIYFQNGKINEIRGTIKSIGGHEKETNKFEKHTISTKNTTFYLFSDGYCDQIGGHENRKYMIKRFRELLTNIQDKSLVEQGQIIENTHIAWKGKQKQIDDVLVVGFRV